MVTPYTLHPTPYTLNPQTYSPNSRSALAVHLPGRSGKQIRERWHNQLDPNVKKERWTPEEDAILMDAHSRFEP